MHRAARLLLLTSLAGCAHAGVRLADPPGTLFDGDRRAVAGEPFLDLRDAQLKERGEDYLLRLRLAGPLPARTPGSQDFYQWDAIIDADQDPSTGQRWPLLADGLGFETLVRLMLVDGQYSSEVLELATRRHHPIEHRVVGDTVELRWPKSLTPSPFAFVVTTRKYGGRGAANAFVHADRAPKAAFARFPPAPLAPGLPTETFESEHATFRYNRGNEARARFYAEAFELAHREVGRALGGATRKPMTFIVYLTGEDLVAGLEQFSAFSTRWRQTYPDGGSIFAINGGAPGPLDYVQHVNPGFDWRQLIHEFVHQVQGDVVGGNGWHSLMWITEGLADSLATRILLETRYRELAEAKRQEHLATARRALAEGRWIPLPELGPLAGWNARYPDPAQCRLQYAEAFAAVELVEERFGRERLLAVLKGTSSDQDVPAAVQGALGLSLADLDALLASSLQAAAPR